MVRHTAYSWKAQRLLSWRAQGTLLKSTIHTSTLPQTRPIRTRRLLSWLGDSMHSLGRHKAYSWIKQGQILESTRSLENHKVYSFKKHIQYRHNLGVNKAQL